jgi:hypothetical protein
MIPRSEHRELAARSRDDGQVLLLTIGLGVAAIGLVVAVVSISGVYMARRSLITAADGAAVAAAQQLDTRGYFLRPSVESLDAVVPIAREVATATAVDYLARASLQGDVLDARVTDVTVTTTGSVTVWVEAVVAAPVLGLLSSENDGEVTVTAVASARSPVRWESSGVVGDAYLPAVTGIGRSSVKLINKARMIPIPPANATTAEGGIT